VDHYQFNDQLVAGEDGEAYLDAFFRRRGHTILPVTTEEQRLGIDRVFVTPTGQSWKVEYKTDFRAGKTGNAFIETVSVDTHGKYGKMGWALTSTAEYLFYYVPDHAIYVIPFLSLRHALPRWMREFPARGALNNRYTTHGVLVPLAQLAEFSKQTFELP